MCCCHLLFSSAPPVPHDELGLSSLIAKTLAGCGSPGRARTADLMINSHPLYRLSYRGMRRNLKLIPLMGQEGEGKFSFSSSLKAAYRQKRCRRSMASCKISMLVANEMRMQPSLPNAEPGTKASPRSCKSASANCTSLA